MTERAGAVADPAPAPPPQNETAFGRLARRFSATEVEFVGIALILVTVVVVFSLISDRFLSIDNGRNILETVSVVGIIAIGQTFVIISGGFDLSVSGVVPLTAVVYAKLCNGGLDWPAAMALAICLGAAIGVANGVIVSKAHINPLIATLAMLSITGGFAYSITSGQSVPLEDEAAGAIADQGIVGVSNYVWVLVGLCIAGILILRYTSYGKGLYALGGNREASWLAGMRVDLLTTSTYTITGGLAALGGVVLASQLLAADGSLGQDVALTSIAAVVLGGGALTGGAGSVFGTIVGVLILGALANGLTLARVSTFYQDIVTGAVLLFAVGFSQLRSVVAERR